MSNSGSERRMEILRNAAEQQMLKPLRTHGWTATISSENSDGEYLVISAAKSDTVRKTALMYTSATDNRIYRQLDNVVDHIFTNGALYMVESFTQGISTPVSSIDGFFPILLEWNKKLAPEVNAPARKLRTQSVRRITAERPSDGIWAHLNQLASVKLAEKLVRRRALEEAIELSDAQVEAKASGIAFSIRNAVDYFRGAPNESINKRILSLYYGSLALAFAEMLASPNGPADLDEVEGMTKQGHGLFTVPSTSSDFGGLNVGVLATGFFPRWVSFLGHETSNFPKSKPKTASDLDKIQLGAVTTFGNLLSSIPELGGLFHEVYDLEPSWVIPVLDMESYQLQLSSNVESSYVMLIDPSSRLTIEKLQKAPWPIAELTAKANDGINGNVFRVRVDHAGFKYWHEVMPIHNTPFVEGGTLILPVLGGVFEYRAISLSILYALSILVRYMPSAWRRVEGGDWDQHFALVKATLDIFERLMPQEFLESITGERVHSKLPGGFI